MATLACCLSFAAALRANPDVPLPPQTTSTDVARRIVYNGLDMYASVFRSKLSQAQVVDYYKQQWGRQVSVSTLQSSRIVGHRDGDYFITVQVSGAGAGSTGTIGMVRLPAADAARPSLGAGLPKPANTRVVNDISYPDDATPARTVLMANALSADQNADYFRSRLISNGWKDAAANDCSYGAGRCVMQFQHGKSRMVLVADRANGRGGSDVLINILDPSGE
jgi:hypothetical protein